MNVKYTINGHISNSVFIKQQIPRASSLQVNMSKQSRGKGIYYEKKIGRRHRARFLAFILYILKRMLRHRYYFNSIKKHDQRSLMICPWSQNCFQLVEGFKPRSLRSKSSTCSIPSRGVRSSRSSSF